MPSANRYTTTELLTSIRLKGHIPPAQTPFDDAGLLSIADDECKTALFRQIRVARENFYVTSKDFTLNATNTYDIPTRAIGASLHDVQIVNGTQVIPVGRSETNEQFSTQTSPTGYYSFTLLANQVKILPIVVSGVVRLYYMQRPNTLVTAAAAAQITGVNQGTSTLTFASGSIPSTFSASGQLFDCVQDQPHFNWNFVDLLPISQNATTMVFSSLPTDVNGNQLIQVGDWISLAGQTPVPQILVEFRPLLVQRTVVKYYEIQGYKDKIATAQKKLEDMEKDVFELFNPRVAGEPKRIIPDANVIGGYRRWRAWSAT